MYPDDEVLKTTLKQFKPSVEKPALLFLAALMWIGVGILLLSRAIVWLGQSAPLSIAAIVTGTVAALIIHHFGFLKVVDKNLARILPMEGRRCLFSFISWKSYFMVAIMAAMGIGLRHSPIPKSYLAVIYIAIGLALILSSIRYLRVLISHIRYKDD